MGTHDCLHRRMIDSSLLATGLTTLDGEYVFANKAMCDFVGRDADTLIGQNWRDLTLRHGQAESDARASAELIDGRRASYRTVREYVHADGHIVWGELTLSCVRDANGAPEFLLAQIIDVTDDVAIRGQLAEARRNEAAAEALYRRSVDTAKSGMALTSPDGGFTEVNDAMCEFFGYDADTLLTKNWLDLTAPGDRALTLKNRDDLVAGRIDSYRMLKQYIHADGHLIWGDITVGCLRDDNGRIQTLVTHIVDVTDEVQARKDLEDSRRQLLVAAERYRQLIDNSIVPLALSGPDGSLVMVNQAMCDLLGYDADQLLTMTWMDLVVPEDLDEGFRATQELRAGLRESYRGRQRLIHADGHLLVVDLSMGCNRNADNDCENVIAQILDITAEVRARDLLTRREEQLSAEIASAARYVESLLPGEITGQVEVTSRYLPSLDVGGDCFHFRWLDDDHFSIYLIDVSGHGVRPALLSVSVHNMIRSGSLPTTTLLRPDVVLTKLNSLFQMEQHDGAYFTMWYGIYESSSRTLRYASGGSPPALAFHPTADGGWEHTALGSTSAPLGLFPESVFDTHTYAVPAECRMLLFSDGAFELPLPDGRLGSLNDLAELAVEQLRKDEFSAAAIVEQLRSIAVDGEFEDDCAIVAIDFD